MGHMLWEDAEWAAGMKPMTIGCIQMVLALAIMIINRAFFVNGFKSVLHGAANMDTLVALGSGVSFLWSVYVLLKPETELSSLYFESAAMILTLITVGKMLEARSKGKTTNALKDLIKLAPETARILRDGDEVEIPTDEVQIGDVIIVKAGEKIPVDAEIIEGHTAVDESALTGESMPLDKKKGDSISAATISLSGYVKARATRVGEDTTLAQIIELVSDAAATKAPIARMADKIAGVFVPIVIGIAIVVFAIWMFIGVGTAAALTRAVAVLVISCPCAMGLATPVAIMAGSGAGARRGILFKTAASLEETGRIEIVALDKTGTLTGGAPAVTDVHVAEGVDEEELLDVAAALEARSEHPLARAICKYIKVMTTRISDFEEVPGKGVRAFVTEGKEAVPIVGGTAQFVLAATGMNEIGVKELLNSADTILTGENALFNDLAAVSGADSPECRLILDIARVQKDTEEYAYAGKTRVYFTRGGVLLGVIAVADSIREDSAAAVAELKALGIHTVMLTGDKKAAAEAIAAEVGVDEVVAEVLPDGKEAVIRQLMEKGKTAMVGDGINDAPALTRADVGIAIGAGTDVALDSADVVLVHSSIADLADAIRLGRKTLRIIKQNLFWAFFYNILLIPLAAGAYTALFNGWTLSPMIAAAAMSLSSFCVCTNALRLNKYI